MKSGTIGLILMVVIVAVVASFIINPNGFSQAISQFGGQASGNVTLAGGGYKKAN